VRKGSATTFRSREPHLCALGIQLPLHLSQLGFDGRDVLLDGGFNIALQGVLSRLDLRNGDQFIALRGARYVVIGKTGRRRTLSLCRTRDKRGKSDTVAPSIELACCSEALVDRSALRQASKGVGAVLDIVPAVRWIKATVVCWEARSR
jgi:hypothetical protein